jgi:hypothetical protein
MLVVLLILMVTTSAAMLALHTANSEVQATGHERIALQSRGVSDAAMVATLAWIDLIGGEGWLKTWRTWVADGPPLMDNYPEPALDPLITQGMATRVTMAAQREINLVAANEVGIVCNTPTPDSGGGGGGGSGGAGGAGGSGGAGGAAGGDGGGAVTGYGCESAFDTNDLVGSFGPTQGYGLPEDLGYVVDFTDCFVAPAALAPGTPLGGTASYDVVAFTCTVTARGRLDLAPDSRSWSYGGTAYTQRVFASAHDSRATIVTPEMIVPKNVDPLTW